MCEFVDEDQLWCLCECVVQIEFGECVVVIVDVGGWQYVEVVEQCGGFVVVVGFDDVDDDVDVILLVLVCGLQYCVGFVDVGGCVEENFELVVLLFFFVLLQFVEKLVWIGMVYV